MEVPGEETIAEIRDRYLEFNWHAESYTWKVLRRESEKADFVLLIWTLTRHYRGMVSWMTLKNSKSSQFPQTSTYLSSTSIIPTT